MLRNLIRQYDLSLKIGGPGRSSASYDDKDTFGAAIGEVMRLIRWKKPGDERAIVGLVRTQLVPISPRPGLRGSRLRRELRPRLRRGATLVASRSARGEPFAFVHVELRSTTLFIDLLAVEPAEQNRRWGSTLLAAAERYGVENGCSESRLFVDENNERGLRFYAKHGYAVVRHIPQAACYELFKPLGASWQDWT